MPVTVLVPTPLRRFVGGDKRVAVLADDLYAALAALGHRHPELRDRLFDDAGRLRSFVRVFLGDQDIRGLGPGARAVPVRDGDVVTLLLAIAGGAPGEVGLSPAETQRYSRHLLMPEVGLAGQLRLKRARVLCVGAGGLGSPLVLYLAAAGVGTLGIVDGDIVELTNLQRQVLYATADVGAPKAEAAAAKVRQLNPDIDVVPHALRLSRENAVDLIGRYDIVADGTDNYATRYLINDACVAIGRPNVHGAVLRCEGQVSVFGGERGPCYRCLFPEPPPPELVPSCAEAGVLGVLPGIVGSLQALEVIKLILGLGTSLVGRLLVVDALELKVSELPIRRSSDCPVCGEHPTMVPSRNDAACGLAQVRADDEAEAPWLSVEDLHRRRQAGEPFILLDVREPHEHAIVQIPGAIPFPLSDLATRLHELDPARTYTLSCHHSTRCLMAYRQLAAAGFRHLQVLRGGVHAWAERIDPSLPRY